MSDNKTFSLDKQEYIKDTIKILFKKINCLYNEINSEDINQERTHFLLQDLEATYKELAELMNYDENFDQHKYNTLEIYRDNQLRNLEDQVKNFNEFSALSKQCKTIEDKFSKFWSESGFHFVRSFQFTSNGTISIKLGFTCDRLAFMGQFSQPVTNARLSKESIDRLRNEGFKFVTDSKKDLLDCDNNKEMIVTLIKENFPSATIVGWESFIGNRKSNEQKIKELEIRIRDYNDILNLKSK